MNIDTLLAEREIYQNLIKFARAMDERNLKTWIQQNAGGN